MVANFYMSYYRQILQSAANFARMNGWQLQQRHFADSASIGDALRRADAVLLGIRANDVVPALMQARLPTVSCSSRVDLPFPRALSDNVAIGRLGAEHLLARGFRRFAFFPNIDEPWAVDRLTGFRQRVEAAGHTMTLAPRRTSRSAKRLAAWLARMRPPLAIMLPYDPAAEVVYAACRLGGLRIPEDVAVASVGDDELVCEVTEPPLTSVRQQTGRIGYVACELLARCIAGKRVPDVTLVPPGQVIVRRSSDALAFDDGLVVDALRFAQTGLADGVGTKQVVAHTGVCRATLDARFMQALGRTVATEIRRMRVERAQDILGHSDLPMPAVARQAGFASAAQLSKTFHTVTGHAPTSYRRQFRLGGAV